MYALEKARAETALDRRKIRSPIDGVDRYLQIGEMLAHQADQFLGGAEGDQAGATAGKKNMRVDTEKIDAEYRDGFLRVILPKTKPQSIEIQE